ncbi:MAG: hypothetical protein ACI4WY_03505 [Anaerovoracaceae bacterium]
MRSERKSRTRWILMGMVCIMTAATASFLLAGCSSLSDERLSEMVPYLDEDARMHCPYSSMGIKTEGIPLGQEEKERATTLLEEVDLHRMERVGNENEDLSADQMLSGLLSLGVTLDDQEYTICMERSGNTGEVSKNQIAVWKNGERMAAWESTEENLPISELMTLLSEVTESRENLDYVLQVRSLPDGAEGQYLKKGESAVAMALFDSSLEETEDGNQTGRPAETTFSTELKNSNVIYQVNLETGRFIRMKDGQEVGGQLDETQVYQLNRLLLFYI